MILQTDLLESSWHTNWVPYWQWLACALELTFCNPLVSSIWVITINLLNAVKFCILKILCFVWFWGAERPLNLGTLKSLQNKQCYIQHVFGWNRNSHVLIGSGFKELFILKNVIDIMTKYKAISKNSTLFLYIFKRDCTKIYSFTKIWVFKILSYCDLLFSLSVWNKSEI